MAIVRWNPNRGTWLLDDFEKMFEDFLPTMAGERVSYPQLDLYEEDDKYVVKADLPGASEKDIDVTFDNGVLTIKGEKESKKEDKKKNYYRSERIYGSFSRSLSIPGNIDANKISAEFDNGVLTLDLPKKEEDKKKKIEIKKK